MANYYIYFISSLPMLHFGAKPLFSFQRFLELSDGLIDEKDRGFLRVLEHLYDQPGSEVLKAKDFPLALKKWFEFDIALRNELVKIRAGRKKIDAQKYLHQDGEGNVELAHVALNIFRNPSVIESERMIDQTRWSFLDELARGHYFDLDVVVIYALKLLILERWEKVREADKEQLLTQTIG